MTGCPSVLTLEGKHEVSSIAHEKFFILLLMAILQFLPNY